MALPMKKWMTTYHGRRENRSSDPIRGCVITRHHISVNCSVEDDQESARESTFELENGDQASDYEEQISSPCAGEESDVFNERDFFDLDDEDTGGPLDPLAFPYRQIHEGTYFHIAVSL